MPLDDDRYAAYESRPPEIEGPGPLGYLGARTGVGGAGVGAHCDWPCRARGLVFMATIHLLFAGGLLIGGIKSINPPDQAIWTYTQFLSAAVDGGGQQGGALFKEGIGRSTGSTQHPRVEGGTGNGI